MIFLQKIIHTNKFSSSLEIGFAFGISALAITEAVVKNSGSHILMDKFEYSDWQGIGMELIQKANYTSAVSFFEAYSYEVLPKLLAEGKQIDFAYIDSTKQFDWLLVDFFYIDKMLTSGGVLVFDDVNFPGIRKLLRLIAQFPNYKVYDVYPKRGLLRELLSSFNIFSKSKKYKNLKYLFTDQMLGINAPCVALQKIDSDNRNYYWHVNF